MSITNILTFFILSFVFSYSSADVKKINPAPMINSQNLAAQKIITSNSGSFGGTKATAELIQTSKDNSKTAALTISIGDRKWVAASAGCLNCDNLSKNQSWQPIDFYFLDNYFFVEYIFMDKQSNNWAFKISYLKDPVMGAPRISSFQRIGVDKNAKAVLLAIDFIAGKRIEKRAGGDDVNCKIANFEPVLFSTLSIDNINSGEFEPPCSTIKDPVKLEN